MITKEDIEKLEKEKKRISDELSQARKKFAIQQCPLGVGDIVDACGYSYRGKKMQITAIRPVKFAFEGDWSVLGMVLKADGKPGQRQCSFSESQYSCTRKD